MSVPKTQMTSIPGVFAGGGHRDRRRDRHSGLVRDARPRVRCCSTWASQVAPEPAHHAK